MADLASIITAIREGLSLARTGVEIGLAIADAAASGDMERVEEILPAEDRIVLARQLAEAKARAKLGPRPDE